MILRDDSVIFLLGAGASVDAGIKHAQQMTEDIETKVLDGGELEKYKDIYYYLKSSIIYQRGLIGDFSSNGTNIEDLLSVLSEINLKHQNTLYPFIGSWNVHLLKVSGEDFERASDLESEIRKQLFKWINIRSYDNANYFSKFIKFADELGSALRIFTLNYDLCVEHAIEKNALELGFNEYRQWEWSRFEQNENTETQVYLYKLHGSIDWLRDEKKGHILTKCDSPQENSDLIFGTTAKLSSRDPYLFYVHELRKYSLQDQLRVIVTIGYSYSDGYINSLVGQAISRNENAIVLSVAPVENSVAEASRISRILEISADRVKISNSTAKDFLDRELSLKFINSLSPHGDDVPF